MEHSKVVVIIVATAIWHNMVRLRPVPASEIPIDSSFSDPETLPSNSLSDFARRNYIIENFFWLFINKKHVLSKISKYVYCIQSIYTVFVKVNIFLKILKTQNNISC